MTEKDIEKIRRQHRTEEYYQNTALLNAHGKFYGWANREKAKDIALQFHDHITHTKYNGKPAIQSQITFQQDPLVLPNQCMVSGAPIYQVHHVLPNSGFNILKNKLHTRGFYWRILVEPHIHVQIEEKVKPHYEKQLIATIQQAHSQEWETERIRTNLMRQKRHNYLDKTPAQHLAEKLKRCGYTSVKEIPTITSHLDPVYQHYQKRQNELKKKEQIEIKKATSRFWRDWARNHTQKDMWNIFITPILALDPKHLPAEITAEWVKALKVEAVS